MNTPAIEPWLDQSAALPSSSMHIKMLLQICNNVKGTKQTKPWPLNYNEYQAKLDQ